MPERAIAYRQLNGLDAKANVPVDAVTASALGLDPDISRGQRRPPGAPGGQGPQPAAGHGDGLVKPHTDGRLLGVLGEKTVNVLDLNLALDALHS